MLCSLGRSWLERSLHSACLAIWWSNILPACTALVMACAMLALYVQWAVCTYSCNSLYFLWWHLSNQERICSVFSCHCQSICCSNSSLLHYAFFLPLCYGLHYVQDLIVVNTLVPTFVTLRSLMMQSLQNNLSFCWYYSSALHYGTGILETAQVCCMCLFFHNFDQLI